MRILLLMALSITLHAALTAPAMDGGHLVRDRGGSSCVDRSGRLRTEIGDAIGGAQPVGLPFGAGQRDDDRVIEAAGFGRAKQGRLWGAGEWAEPPDSPVAI